LFADEVAIIDEIQMMRDPQRGWAWTRALLGICAYEVHLCGEAAAIDLVQEIIGDTGDEMEVSRRIFVSSVQVVRNDNQFRQECCDCRI
jgi:ATP-dependent RNA helicase SUPV3L1/SUV3